MKTQRTTTKHRRSTTALPASGRRLNAHTAVADDLGYEPEPHMKLSRALFIVVLMHIVVIAGLFGFQSLRDRAGATRPDLAAENYPRTMTESGLDDASTARIHFVRGGETLSSIAAYYGVSVKELATANKIIDAGQILLGQELKIPPRSAKAPPPLDLDNIAAMTRSTTAPPARPAASQEIRSRPKSSAPAAAPAKAQQGGDAADAALRDQFLEAKAGRPASPPSTAEGALKEQFLEAKSAAAAPVPALAPSARPAAAPGGVYLVQKGDNPVAIAKRFNVSYNELLKVNNIADPKKLQVGQKLKIPQQ